VVRDFPQQASRIWNGGLVRDLENFNFLHYEIQHTCENSFLVRAGVVLGIVAKETATAGVFVAVIVNNA
jgi:hypothetical protein